MMGIHKGVKAFVEKKQLGVYIAGCPCHLIHIGAEKAAQTLPVAVEELLIDIFYYLDKSTKRSLAFKEFQMICGVETRKILKHAATRWLSLSACLARLVQQWEPLTRLFRSECSVLKNVNKSLKLTNEKSKAKNITKSKSHSTKVQPMFKQTPSYVTPRLNTVTAKSGSKSPSHKSADETGNKSSKSASKSTAKLHSKSPDTKSSTKSTAASSKEKSSSSRNRELPEKRVDRVYRQLVAPQSKLYCLFVLNANQVFDKANLTFQREDPIIHFVQREFVTLIKELMLRFVKPNVLSTKSCITEIEYIKPENQRNDNELFVGSEVVAYLKDNAEKLSSRDIEVFYSCVRKFYCRACEYLIKKLPIKDELLQHAEIADVSLRKSKSFKDVEYFTNWFPTLIPSDKLDQLELEFLRYQVEESLDRLLTGLTRIDDIWNHIAKMKDNSGCFKYNLLSKVIKSILVIPHGNADCERIFSLVRKNKTVFRPNLSVDSLEDLIVEKVNMISSGVKCHQKEFSDKFLHQTKKYAARRAAGCTTVNVQ